MFHALLNYEIELEWQFVLREPDTTKKTKQGGGAFAPDAFHAHYNYCFKPSAVDRFGPQNLLTTSPQINRSSHQGSWRDESRSGCTHYCTYPFPSIPYAHPINR